MARSEASVLLPGEQCTRGYACGHLPALQHGHIPREFGNKHSRLWNEEPWWIGRGQSLGSSTAQTSPPAHPKPHCWQHGQQKLPRVEVVRQGRLKPCPPVAISMQLEREASQLRGELDSGLGRQPDRLIVLWQRVYGYWGLYSLRVHPTQ